MGVSHVDLLARAREMQLSAVRGDADSLHVQLCGLRNALTEHLREESDEIDRLSVVAAEAVRSGQRRLLGQVDDLLIGSPHDVACCACVDGASHVMQLLYRQARLEATLLVEYHARHPGAAHDISVE